MTEIRNVPVVVVGGGPAGLTAAKALAAFTDVLVLEREPDVGGIPRHSNHVGYGLRDLKTFTTGPKYARRLKQRAEEAGAELMTSAMVTGAAGRTLQVTSPQGLVEVRAQAIVLATGARERPRAARLIPGDRPSGVVTTGELQNHVHLFGHQVGSRAVIVGSELVSWSAVLTLRHAGARTALLVTSSTKPETSRLVATAGSIGLGVRVACGTSVARIIGKGHVEAVELLDQRTGQTHRVECDAVVFTADWIPDNELSAELSLELDGGSLAPIVDAGLRTGAPGIFGAGNLLHPVDTADRAALDGTRVAASVQSWLTGQAENAAVVDLRAKAPLAWIAPGRIRHGDPPPFGGKLLAKTKTHARFPTAIAIQDDTVIGRLRLTQSANPGSLLRIPYSLLSKMNPAGSEIDIHLA